MNNQPNIQPSSLRQIAKLYPMKMEVLKDMIRIENPILYNRIQAFCNEKKRLLPPTIVQEIFTTIGNP